MSEHIIQWLGAYHDGELHGARLRRVEAHLSECTACRAELDAIQDLSQLLRRDVPEADFLSSDRFAANLALQLPRRSDPPPAQNLARISWWMVPVGLLAAFVFVNITLSISTTVAFAANSGLFGSSLNWLQGSMPQMTWFSAATQYLGSQLGATGFAVLSLLNDANVRIVEFAGPLLLQGILAVAYLGWLLSWWIGDQERAASGNK